MRRKRVPIKIGQHSAPQVTEPELEEHKEDHTEDPVDHTEEPTSQDNPITEMKQQLKETFASSIDVEYRALEGETKQADLLYIKSVCDQMMISHRIIGPFWELASHSEFESYISTLPTSQRLDEFAQAERLLPQGYVVVFFADSAYLIEMIKVEAGPVSETKIESTVQGPRDAFTENIMVNLNLIRLRYQSSDLQIDLKQLGKVTSTQIMIVYDKKLVNKKTLEELQRQLDGVDVDMLISASHLHRLLAHKKWAVFPIIVSTERPDRTVINLSRGKVILFVDHTPLALIVPSVFSDFFLSMDDQHQLPMIGGFLIALRFIGLFITLTLPALYVGTVSYNPEFFRVQLALSIAGSRTGVPYPSFLEVIIMLLMMEFLTEASIRLPRAVGPAATTVGGLILGQAATQAGLVSNIMIIIVAAVAISNYVIPIATMNFAIRVVKYFLLLLAVFYGLVGVVTGIVALVFYLTHLESFGTPYVKAFRRVGRS